MHLKCVFYDRYKLMGRNTLQSKQPSTQVFVVIWAWLIVLAGHATQINFYVPAKIIDFFFYLTLQWWSHWTCHWLFCSSAGRYVWQCSVNLRYCFSPRPVFPTPPFENYSFEDSSLSSRQSGECDCRRGCFSFQVCIPFVQSYLYFHFVHTMTQKNG